MPFSIYFNSINKYWRRDCYHQLAHEFRGATRVTRIEQPMGSPEFRRRATWQPENFNVEERNAPFSCQLCLSSSSLAATRRVDGSSQMRVGLLLAHGAVVAFSSPDMVSGCAFASPESASSVDVGSDEREDAVAVEEDHIRQRCGQISASRTDDQLSHGARLVCAAPPHQLTASRSPPRRYP